MKMKKTSICELLSIYDAKFFGFSRLGINCQFAFKVKELSNSLHDRLL